MLLSEEREEARETVYNRMIHVITNRYRLCAAFNGIKTIIKFNKIEFHMELMNDSTFVQFIIIVLVVDRKSENNLTIKRMAATAAAKKSNQQQHTWNGPINDQKNYDRKRLCDFGISKKITHSPKCTSTQRDRLSIETLYRLFNLNISWCFNGNLVTAIDIVFVETTTTKSGRRF